MSVSGGSLLVQYILVRGDLGWPAGAVIAQACHACTAVNHVHSGDPDTSAYLADLDHMHKVVLRVPDEEQLTALSRQLTQDLVLHKLWIEQPENTPTCLVLKPYPKNKVQQYFKQFKLY